VADGQNGRRGELEREQSYLTRLYERLDALRDQTRARLTEVRRRGAAGTHQNRSERDSFAGMYEARLAQLNAVESGLVFGRLDMTGGDRHHIGRIGLTDEGHDTLLVDWRAPVAEPFYRATPADPHGVIRRRHLRTRGRALLDVEDDVFNLEAMTDADRATLGGEGALLAALSARRTGRMRDIVETIQAEQDKVIRSDLDGVLVVQGGPGTGKTAVALHRAAYLLYSHRDTLSRTGVLVLGPNAVFLRYIEQVLPSLGETGVVLSTLGGLLPGVTVTATEPTAVAQIKSELRMAELVEAAIAARQRVPREPRTIGFDEYELVLDPAQIATARSRARRSRRRHNRARYAFAKQLLRFLVGQIAEHDAELAKDRYTLRQIMQADDFRELVDYCWPRLTAGELVRDLLTERGLARAGRDLLTSAEQRLLVKAPDAGWTAADVPLLDEAWLRLGDPEEVLREAAERRKQRADREYAQQVIASTGTGALVDAGTLAARFEAPGGGSMSLSEKAGSDPDWEYGHIIVDEAQELSPMAWRMLIRRCPMRSMTVVGDTAQASAPWGVHSWADTLSEVAPNRWQLRELTVNYRTPSEIMAVAAQVLAAVDPGADSPSSVRDSGEAPLAHRVQPGDELATVVSDVVEKARAAVGEGKLAVLTAPASYDAVLGSLRARFGSEVGTGAAGLDAPVALLQIGEAKGLEFDAVVLAEPSEWLVEGDRGLRDLYVALTRATQRLDVVHTGELPAVLSGLDAS
jgi:DNA helicase IV